MRLIPILVHYVWWHYTTAIADLVRNYLDLASWLENFFSLGHLSRNLFSPWRRLGEEYPEHFDLEAFFTALVVNTLMRLVGVVIRLVILLIGLVSVVLSFILFVIILGAWLAMPLILIFLIVLGFKLLIE